MKRLSIAAAVAAALFASAASAEVININNPSFESPTLADGTWVATVEGWTAVTANGTVGIWNPALDQPVTNPGVTQAFLDGISGEQVAYSNGGNIRQDLAIDVGYGYLYTLKVDVGGREGYSNEPYGILLRADPDGPGGVATVTVASVSGKNIASEWVEQTVTFEALDPAVANQKLVVVLANRGTTDTDTTTDGIQVNFDDVRLSRAKLVSCEGFFAPFAEPLSLQAKNRRSIPVKMRLYDYHGNELTDADFAYPPVAVVDFEAGNNGIVGESDVVLTAVSDDGLDFRYDSNEGQWILNLSTKPYRTAGTYTVSVKSADPDFAVSSLGSCSQDFVRQ
jgi:hypothetical protein